MYADGTITGTLRAMRLWPRLATLVIALLALAATVPQASATALHCAARPCIASSVTTVAAIHAAPETPRLPGPCSGCRLHAVNCTAGGCAGTPLAANVVGATFLAAPLGDALIYSIGCQPVPASRALPPEPPPLRSAT